MIKEVHRRLKRKPLGGVDDRRHRGIRAKDHAGEALRDPACVILRHGLERVILPRTECGEEN